MRRVMTFFATLALTAAASLGCVPQSQYDALQIDRDALQMRLNQIERSTSSERESMRSQLDQHSFQAQAARSDTEMCRFQMAQLQQMQAESARNLRSQCRFSTLS